MQQRIVPPRSGESRRFVMRAALAVAAVFLASMTVLMFYWPFSRNAVLNELERASQSRVEIGAYHGAYFPRPGCVLEHVTFQQNAKGGVAPLITVDKLTIEGSFSGLFTKHLKRIQADGLHLFMPPQGSGEHFRTPERSAFVIDDVSANGAALEVALQDRDKPPLKFVFHNFALHQVGSTGPASFEAKFSNPEPPGEITATGKFGPWNQDDLGKTPVSGNYSFEQADLGVFGGISGILSSSGEFSGAINHIEAQGQIDTPEFAVTSSSHQVELQTQFHAVVNGENGDTFLQKVTSNFLRTTISSEGSVAGKAGQNGKTTSLDLAAKDGRIQDLLLLFVHSERAPMSGMVSFHARVSIPPGRRAFLEKVELQGDFGVDNGAFTKLGTQEGVNHLSKGALGAAERHTPQKDKAEPDAVLSDLKGHVLLKDGSAVFSNLSFSVPGALAQLQGTYNLITEKIDLHGTLRTDSEPAKTTSGIKTAMLRVLEPLFKKKRRGYVMPVKVTGTYKQPLFGLDLMRSGDNRSGKVRAPRLSVQAGH
jgi:hypothetical protein